VEEIAMKKPKTVAKLLAVNDGCIEASEAWARPLESRGKGPSRKKDNREVNTADREIPKTEESMDIAASSPWRRRKRGPSSVPMMLKSGVRSITPQDMIWRSARLF
jgi:hypothetical protein